MSSSGQIRWSKIRGHLNRLLPGWKLRVTDHHRTIRYGGRVVQLSKGAHGRSDPEIPIREVKHLFRVFEKLDEARKTIRQLR